MAKAVSTLDQILGTLPSLSKAERRKLLDSLCLYQDLLEDLHDILTLIERKDEPSRSYEEFVEELRAKGKL
jgi:hypothetical protein